MAILMATMTLLAGLFIGLGIGFWYPRPVIHTKPSALTARFAADSLVGILKGSDDTSLCHMVGGKFEETIQRFKQDNAALKAECRDFAREWIRQNSYADYRVLSASWSSHSPEIATVRATVGGQHQYWFFRWKYDHWVFTNFKLVPVA